MIKVVWNIVKKIFNIFCMVLSPLKRLWCRRKRRNSDTILPLTNHYPSVENLNSNYSPLEGSGQELGSWDNWDEQQRASTEAARVRSVEEYRQRQQLQRETSQEPEPEPDYFQDMTPQVKKQKKVLIKKKEDTHTSSISSKLAMSSDVPLMPSSELESWDDQNNAWEDEDIGDDVTWEADNVIREQRRAERQQRQLQHQKRKQERENRQASKHHSQLAAVKLS